MWILFRAICAIAGFVIRLLTSLKSTEPLVELNGIQFFEKSRRDKSRTVVKHTIGVPMKGDVLFIMTPESTWDGFFKSLGLSKELQTGDPDFDKHVYVACDHPFFCESFCGSSKARDLIKKLLTTGFAEIHSDGRYLYGVANGEVAHTQMVPLLGELQQELKSLSQNRRGRFRDVFAARVLIVEAFIWSMAGYALAAILDYSVHKEDLHVYPRGLIPYGVIGATLASCFLLVLIVLFLQRSSRSHRILIESSLLLFISLPIFGIQAASDFNRGGDTAEPMVVIVKVEDFWMKEHRGRRGRRWYSYHMRVRQTMKDDEAPLPEQIDISREVYDTLRTEKDIPIELGRGRLGLLWYKSINGVDYEAL